MTLTRLIALGAAAAVLAGPGRALLVRTRRTERAPRAGIVLFQALGAAIAISLVGVCVEAVRVAQPGAPTRHPVSDFYTSSVSATRTGMTPGQLFALTAALIVGTLALGSLLARLSGHAHARARQRLLIDLLARERSDVPGALVLPSEHLAAFSLSGFRGRVVVSAGALEALANDEVAAVLAHERAHVCARHDLVLWPFRALALLAPSSSAIARVHDEVAALVEMAADDRVIERGEPTALARALCRLALAEPPHDALFVGAGDTALQRRVERVLVCRRGGRALACGYALSAGLVVALPIMALVLPIAR